VMRLMGDVGVGRGMRMDVVERGWKMDVGVGTSWKEDERRHLMLVVEMCSKEGGRDALNGDWVGSFRRTKSALTSVSRLLGML